MESKRGKLRLSARTDVGLVRDHNEDNFVIARDVSLKDWIFNDTPFTPGRLGTLLMVADGMGGTNAGEVASEIAVNAIREFFSSVPGDLRTDDGTITAKLVEAIHFAQKKIVTHALEFPDTAGMGTTIVMSWVLGEKVYTAWSGDSRAYLYRPVTGLVQMSKDHSYVQELVDKGKITAEQAFYHPESNIITQSLGDEEHPPKPETRIFSLAKGDRVLLCSDGLCGMIQDDQITEILKNNPDTGDCLKVLIEEANNAGGHDNITAVICEILDGNDAQDAPVAPENVRTNKPKKRWGLWILLVVVVALGVIGYSSGWFASKKTATVIPQDSIIEDNKVNTDEVDSNISTQKNREALIPAKTHENQPADNPADEKSHLMSLNDAAELLKIAKKVDLYYKKLALTPDSVNVNGFSLRLKNLLKTAIPKTSQACDDINSLLTYKKKLVYIASIPFENAIRELEEFKGKTCK